MVQKRSASSKRQVAVVIAVSLLAIVLVSFLVQFYQGKTVVGKAAATGYACGGVTNGLISWWSFEENNAASVSISDSFGNNDGGAPNFVSVPGKIGKAYSLLGTDNYYTSISNQLSQNPSNALTISAWIKPASVNDFKTIISKPVSTGWNAPYARYNLRINSGKLEFWTQEYLNRKIQSTTILQTDTWYHVVATYDGSNEKIYINGALDNTLAATGAITSSTQDLVIGSQRAGPDNDAEWFHGLIDELALYSRALNEDEIKKLYEIGNQDTCQPILVVDGTACPSDNINCFNSACHTNADCGFGNAPCGSQGETVAWSRLLPSESTETGAPDRVNCCKPNQCANVNSGTTSCEDFGTTITLTDGEALCNDDRNWYTCSAAQNGEKRLNDQFECDGANVEWDIVCSSTTKYRMKDGDTKICDGQQFQTCPNAALLSNLFVGVTCDSQSKITVQELICNNDVDDDNDGAIDTDDTDCSAASLDLPLSGTTRYEVIIKATDTFKLNIKK